MYPKRNRYTFFYEPASGRGTTVGTVQRNLSVTLDTDADGTVSLEEILARAGDRSYGMILLLLSLPCFIPVLPPGTSGVVGALMSLVALQMLMLGDGFRRIYWGERTPRNDRESRS